MYPPSHLSRREFLRWSTLSAATSALAGCSLFRRPASEGAGEGAVSAPTAAPAATASKPKLVYARPDMQEFEILETLIERFNASGLAPGVQVEDVELSGDPFAALQAMAAGGTPADVHIVPDEYIPEWARQGYLLSLEPFLAADQSFDLGDFYEQYLANVQFNGQLWALPWTCAAAYLFINRDLFDAAEVPAPAPDWSWDDFRQTARELTGEDPRRWGCAPVQGWWQMAERLWQAGVEAFSPGRDKCLLDEPEAVEALQFWVDLVLEDGVAPNPREPQGQNTWGMFRNGRVAMYEDWLVMIQAWKEAPFRWEIACQPYRSRRVNALMSGSQGITAATQHRQEAWLLLRYLTGTEALIAWSTAMRLPSARKSANAQKPYIDPAIDIDWDLVPQGVDNGRLPDITPRNLEVTRLLEGMVRDLFDRERTVQEVVSEYVPQIDGLIEGGFGA